MSTSLLGKRVIDVLLSAVGVILLAPLALLVAGAIRVESGGPVIFKQLRVGRGGIPFSMLKFRTMVVGADSLGPYFTRAGDPRITAVGRFLRKTSLDEAPQLVNVLFGDMSLIGPRPELPIQQVNYNDAEWRVRHSLRPGVTGLAQIKTRRITAPRRRKRYDIFYAKHHSLCLDAYIFLETLRPSILKSEN